MTYPTGEAGVYTYDANHNMVTSGVEGEEYTTRYEYNKQNQVTKIHNIDGGTVTKNYDSAGRLQLLNDTNKDGKVLYVNIFTYDVLGRITSELNPIEMIDYRMTYDSLGRVTQRTECDYRTNEAIHTETFTYDSAGNILTAVSPDGTENTYQYDQNNFIEKMNEDGIGVTVNGNTATCMINGKKVDISYDITNRLKKIDGDMNEYWYDADNNRINMYYYHTNMKYAYDCSGGRSRLVWTSDHNLNVSSYFYGAEGLLWSRCNGEYQVYHYDYRGSVVAVTDIDGNVTDTLKYDAYGSTIERTGESALIFGYNGQYGVLTDPNGLLYMRTRFYNPQLKRFMNADILDGSIADSTTLNLYTYVNGNPISYVDPFGMSAERGQDQFNQWKPRDLFSSNFLDWALADIRYLRSLIVSPDCNDMVIKALNNMDKAMKLYYDEDYNRSTYVAYHDAIDKIIYGIENGKSAQEFASDVKVRIEIEKYYNVSAVNVIGDFAGFVPILGEIYTLVDIMSDENANLSDLGSVLISAITEKDIAKLTPYVDQIEKFSRLSKILNSIGMVSDFANWNSPENIKRHIFLS